MNSVTETPDSLFRKLKNPALLARIRLRSGLVLFAYVTGHLSNHALGLISTDLMESAGEILETFWRFLPLSIVLYGSLFLHFSTALLRVFGRRSLKMPLTEWVQLIMGLAIPFLLVVHVMGTRYASARYGLHDSYDYVLLSTFVFSPLSGWMNAAGLIAAWLHGCLGLHMWANLKPWYSRQRGQAGFAFALLLPTLALCGYLSAGREVAPKATDGEFMGDYYEKLNIPDDAVWGWLAHDIDVVRYGLVVIIALGFSVQIIRNMLRMRTLNFSISYVDGPTIKQAPGASLLEMSRMSGVPHASVCGGRGRCSTCRVRILTPDPLLNPLSESESRVLARVKSAGDVRLACQIFPRSDLQVMRLLPTDGTPLRSADLEPWASGREKVVTVMFADIREFTRTSEARLPFDVVYLINQFSQSMGKAVERNSGRIDKFLGDGFMALFGVDGSPEKGAADALATAGEMVAELQNLNTRLAHELSEPMRMGIGIHTGSVILGTMGYGSARGLTAIGDTVNTASRLEAATKELACVVCASADTLRFAASSAPESSRKRITVRGKQEQFDVVALNDIQALQPTAKNPDDQVKQVKQ